ncbi:unnamed protein product [Clavelina lepadiformis]|uniref:CABIT domain-containing protein n=2 Tax=Clavelina lepadiformis TaxID=159417 RepID=A0ABP0F299_CLALP
MDDVLSAGTKLNWSDEEITIDEIQKQFGLPQIVKFSPNAAKAYNAQAGDPVLLLETKRLIRLVAQSVEEGHYVIGKQVGIPHEYSGHFRINNDYERDETTLKKFRSMQEVADAFPPKVYVQEPITVTVLSNTTDETSGKLKTVDLRKGDELTLVNRMELQANTVPPTKPASRLISKVRMKSHQSFLVVHSTRLNESLSLPVFIQGRFATQPPLMVTVMESRGVLTLQQIMEKVNLPVTVTVAANSTRSVKDEFVLRVGMHLKLVSLEEHIFVAGILPHQKIIEVSAESDTYFLPCALMNTEVKDKLKNQYYAYVKSAAMTTKLQNNPSNVEDYYQSVRFHQSLNKYPTKPTHLNANANLRSLRVPSPAIRRKYPANFSSGVSAIHLLTPQPADSENGGERSTRVKSAHSKSLRRRLPTPGESLVPGNPDTPPLPPRNVQMSLNMLEPLPGSNNGMNDPSNAGAPPIPPKARLSPGAARTALENMTPPPPLRNPPSLPRGRPHSSYYPATSLDDFSPSNISACEEENIWAEFNPPSENNSVTDQPDSNHQVESSDFPGAFADFSEAPTSAYENVSLSCNVEQGDTSNDSPCFSLISASEESQNTEERTEDIYTLATETELTYENLTPNPTFSAEEECDEQQEIVNNLTNHVQSAIESDAIALETVESAVSPVDEASEADEVNDRVTSSNNSVAHEAQDNGLPEEMANQICSGDEEAIVHTTQFSTTLEKKQYVTPPIEWTPADDVSTFTVEEVANSFRYIGLSEDVVTSFYNERIDGAMLLDLTDDILENDMGLSKLYRLKISRFISGWRPKLWKSNPAFV